MVEPATGVSPVGRVSVTVIGERVVAVRFVSTSVTVVVPPGVTGFGETDLVKVTLAEPTVVVNVAGDPVMVSSPALASPAELVTTAPGIVGARAVKVKLILQFAAIPSGIDAVNPVGVSIGARTGTPQTVPGVVTESGVTVPSVVLSASVIVAAALLALVGLVLLTVTVYEITPPGATVSGPDFEMFKVAVILFLVTIFFCFFIN